GARATAGAMSRPVLSVIPAQAGTHLPEVRAAGPWVPAFAGMTIDRLYKLSRGLRHGLPEIGVVAEDDAGTGFFERGEAVERRQHLYLVVDVARQAAFAQGLAEIA